MALWDMTFLPGWGPEAPWMAGKQESVDDYGLRLGEAPFVNDSLSGSRGNELDRGVGIFHPGGKENRLEGNARRAVLGG